MLRLEGREPVFGAAQPGLVVMDLGLEKLLGALRILALAAQGLIYEGIQENAHHTHSAIAILVLVNDTVDASGVAVLVVPAGTMHRDCNARAHRSHELLLPARVDAGRWQDPTLARHPQQLRARQQRLLDEIQLRINVLLHREALKHRLQGCVARVDEDTGGGLVAVVEREDSQPAYERDHGGERKPIPAVAPRAGNLIPNLRKHGAHNGLPGLTVEWAVVAGVG